MVIEQIAPHTTWRLRRDILYPSQKIFEMEMEEDTRGIHSGAYRDDQLVGVISLFQNESDFQFRKLAVQTDYQKMGIGSALLQWVIQYAKENNGTRIWCNARSTATGFYEKADFNFTGKTFTKNGIAYEIWEKSLSSLKAINV